MGSSQIWPCHRTQAKNLSFPYLKSYCPLKVRKNHQISWFCCIPNRSYKEDNLKKGRIGLSNLVLPIVQNEICSLLFPNEDCVVIDEDDTYDDSDDSENEDGNGSETDSES